MDINKLIKHILIIAILIMLSQPSLQAQSEPARQAPPVTKISGFVTDAATERPIEYATIALRNQNDSLIVTGTITNEIGYFFLERIQPGRYDVEVTFIGFNKFIAKDIKISYQKPQIDLGTIRLKPVAINLAAVTVTGEKKPIEYTLDKKIVNIDNNLATMGGTAADVLQTVPSVTVDIDGSVSLRGSADVTILVDGRPSQIVSLDEIPASMIDRIEIVTNPSARYDPEGMVGIINIILKKKRAPGYNGVITLNAGTSNRYNSSINFNYRFNKLNFFINYDNRFGNMIGGSNQRRSFTLRDTINYLNQEGDFHNNMQFHNFKVGADYYINSQNILTLSGLYNIRRFSGDNFTSYSSLDYQSLLTDYYTRKNDNSHSDDGMEWNLDYKKTFAEQGRELTANVFYSTSSGNHDTRAVQQYFYPDYTPGRLPDLLQNTFSDDRRKVLTVQSDYVHPFNQLNKLEAGFKSTFRRSDSDYRLLNYDYSSNLWVTDTNATNHFIYDQQIHAIYGIYTSGWKKLQYQLGLRLEQAVNFTDLKTTNQTNRHSYFSYFPSGFLRYTFQEGQGVQMNYSRRINRPYSRALNPFVDYSDPQNLSFGNPDLEPEYVDALELSNFWETMRTSVYANLYYRQVNGMITRITELGDDGITYTTFKNLNNSRSYGLELILDHRITKWWRLNANWNFFHSEMNGPYITQKEAQQSTSWNTKITSMITLNRTTDFQIYLFYNSPSLSGMGGQFGRGFMSGGGQGRTKAMYSVNVGLRKVFLDGKLTMNIRIADLLKSSNFDMVTYGSNFKTYLSRWRDSRMVFLGISYKINEGDRQKKRKQPQDEEIYLEEYQ